MTIGRVARVAGILLIVTALFDPACVWQRAMPLPVDVRAATADAADAALARRIRQTIARASSRIEVDSPRAPRVVVLAGAPRDPRALPDALPVSIVIPSEPALDTRVVDVIGPSRALVGQTATIEAVVEARGAQGRTTRIALELDGGEIAAVDHRWTGEQERFRAAFRFAPAAAGHAALRVVARPLDGESSAEDNHLDLAPLVEDRRLRVLVVEPRPSWAAAFVRRALEADPLFEVAAISRPAPGLAIKSGSAPDRLAPETLRRFDAVIVGAPEELRPAEVDVLREFARARGGAIVLLPDRRPSGPYAALVPASRFDEVLLESPVLAAGAVASLRASELAVPIDPASHVEVLAAAPHRGRELPVVFAWPEGAGVAMFGGALDAWRYRDRAEEYSRFWRAEIAQAALAAPPGLEIDLQPSPARPGAAVEVRARFRRTELDDEGRPPAVRAEVAAPDGTRRRVRLWPTAAPATFAGLVEPRGPGLHTVRVSSGDVLVERPFAVRVDGRAPAAAPLASARAVADATGGALVRHDQLSELIRSLESMAAAREAVRSHPARSPWWMCAAVLLLALEWTLRRRAALA